MLIPAGINSGVELGYAQPAVMGIMGHPLVTESLDGITYERLLEIYADYGHGPAVP